MLAELRGIQDMNFPDGHGGQVDGISLQLVYRDPGCIGMKTKAKYIPRDEANNMGFTVDSLRPLIGKVVDIELNLQRKVLGIKATDQKISV